VAAVTEGSEPDGLLALLVKAVHPTSDAFGDTMGLGRVEGGQLVSILAADIRRVAPLVLALDEYERRCRL